MLMGFVALTLTGYVTKPVAIGKPLLRNLVFILPFLPYLIEFCVYGNNPTAHFEFEKKIFFFTAPIIIPVFVQVTGFKNYKLALMVFSASVCILTIYTFGGLVIHKTFFAAESYQNGAYLLRYHFERISGLHPTYYSIFALTAGWFFCQATSVKNNFRLVYYIFAALLFAAVMVLAVRIALAASVVLVLVWIIRSKLSNNHRILMTIGALAAFIFISFTVPSLKNRLNEFLLWDTSKTNHTNTISQRATIMDCSWQVFINHWLWGCGSRNFQLGLNECYNAKGWPQGRQNEFNPHNQYVLMGINYGIFILFVFLGCLCIILCKIFKLPIGIYFGLMVLFFFMSEAMLERQMGVYFFGLIALLLYNIKNPKLSQEATHIDSKN